MAGFADLLQRIVRDLEQAGAQGPEDDLRARLGYGPADDAGDVDEDPGGVDETHEPGSIWGSRPARTRAADPEAAWEPGAVRGSDASGGIGTVPRPEAPRAPARTRPPAPGTHRTPPPSPAGHPHTSIESPLTERIRARLGTPDALREAFVMKELLDGPLGLRRTRRGSRSPANDRRMNPDDPGSTKTG